MNDAAALRGSASKTMYPALTVADAAPEAEQHFLTAVADWCDRYTPLIGLDPPDALMLDCTGCAHLFGGEAALGQPVPVRADADRGPIGHALTPRVGSGRDAGHGRP